MGRSIIESWIKDNKSLYKGLEVGQIYVVFENEAPVKLKEGVSFIKTLQATKSKKATTIRVSKKGNPFVYKIAICRECGGLKASKKMRRTTCSNCLSVCMSKKVLTKYHKTKAVPTDGITPKKRWYRKLIPGKIYVIFEGNEVVRLRSVKTLFKPGRGKFSPFTGAKYIGRICICAGKGCGKKRFSKVRLGSLCEKCQQNKYKEDYKEKKKLGIKTVKEIAFEITGSYQKVEEKPCGVDVFDDLWRNKEGLLL